MHIRMANLEDIEQLRRLYLELEMDGVKYQPEHFTVGYRSDVFFNSIFENDNQDILVADVDGTIIGFSHVMILKQKSIACLKPQTAIYIQDLLILRILKTSKSLETMPPLVSENGCASFQAVC